MTTVQPPRAPPRAPEASGHRGGRGKPAIPMGAASLSSPLPLASAASPTTVRPSLTSMLPSCAASQSPSPDAAPPWYPRWTSGCTPRIGSPTGVGGKSPETIELTGKVSSKEARRALLSRLSDEERATLRAILQRAVDRGARAEAKAGSADPPPDQASEGPGEDLAATDAAEALTPTRRATRAREPRPRSGCREGSIRGVARAGAQEQRTAVSRVAERGSRSLRLRLQGELALAGAEEPEESKQVEHEGDHQAWILSGSE
jgi:hypothetical protein